MKINNTFAVLAFIVSIGLFPESYAQTVKPEQQAPDAAYAQTQNPFNVTIQVTASRFGEPIQEVPGAISVVTGEEIRARGATDLRTALALVGGVSVAPGGDAGPAGAVPGLLGVREVDDLLLLIDGIPAGGAFVPQVEAISLTNVERIEVLRGATPVFYGTTAFAGTINVIHYPAGHADHTASVRYGSYNSGGMEFATVLSSGRVRQSIRGEVSKDNLSGERASYGRAQGGWRLATKLGGGNFTADVDLLGLRQKPNSPHPIDEATGQFTTLLPVDFNQNPADAKIDTDRYKLVLGYEVPLSFGRWGNTVAYTQTHTDDVRGFIEVDDTPQPWTATTNSDLESFSRSLRLRELFVDSNITAALSHEFDLTTGVNLLVGRAHANSLRYGLRLPLDGVSQAPDIESVSPKGSVDFVDDRQFVGLYAQSRFHVSSRANLLFGLRWNDTHETRNETRVNRSGVATTTPAAQDINRLSGSVGAEWMALQFTKGPIHTVTLHASGGNTFQPAQIEFGPNPEAKPEGGGLLKPETQRSFVGGVKATALDGLADFDIDGFYVDFYNQPVQATSGGVAVLRPVGHQRFKAIDFEGSLRPARGWTIKGSFTRSNATYIDFLTDINGVPTQLAGNRQVLTPLNRATAGLIYSPLRGWRGSFTSTWTGQHWLNSENTFDSPDYTVLDAYFGYRFEKFTLSVSGSNLTDRRDAVQASELGEGQFYRLNARRVEAELSWHFK